MMEETPVEILAETEDFSVWRVEEPDGEVTYHLEFGMVTVHLFEEEWNQFVALAGQIHAS
jgi:hypothetical protein